MDPIKKVLFMGSKRLGLRVLRELRSLSPESLIGALTIDDSEDPRTVLNEIRTFSASNDIGFYLAKDRKHSEELIRDLKPDLCLVVCWYWLISERALGSVPHGFIGLHNSLLPRGRGGSPLVWSIINGDKQVGFSLFSFTAGMDEGAIWAQASIPLEDQDYVSDVLGKLEEKTIEVLRERYLSILKGAIEPVEQKHEQATYCAQRSPDDGKVDWSQPARDVYNFIRAQSDPYPGAFTYYESRRLRIWKARLFEPLYHGTPGQVAKTGSDGIYVICGDDRAVILEELELDGKRGVAHEFIKSREARLSGSIRK